FLILGHNAQVAWGFTTTHGDTQDFFVEKLAADDPESYLTPAGPRRFETRVEEIAIKDRDPERVTYRSSRHGPIMDDVLGARRPDWADDRRLALSWAALREDDRVAQALYYMNHARDAAAFKAALADFNSPEQNVVYADRAGHIGFLAAGRVPIRKAGNGQRPVPGWTGDNDWTGFIPFEDLPQDEDPADGDFIAANNKIVPDDYPYLITAHWQRPFRAERIATLLGALPRSGPDDAERMQLDIVSPGALLLLPRLLAAVADREDTADFYEMLLGWDGEMARDRAEPLLYSAWITALNEALLRDELGDDFQAFRRPDPARLANLLEHHPQWCDNTTTSDVESCAAVISDSLSAALTFLGKEYGTTLQKWRWGDAHFAPFEHPVFSRVPLIADWLSFGLDTDGGDDTLNRGVSRYAGPVLQLFEHVAGAGFRAVYDLSDLDASRFISATGQSGNPLSPYYGNMTRRWRDGLYVRLDGRAGEDAETLTLLPQ
ncbi:MAG TPA: penicillin acylase family protein, partial [Kiloniellaceae bacterium]|nr:penicillin acylase family protein [Kiloniellaceae bacterium]